MIRAALLLAGLLAGPTRAQTTDTLCAAVWAEVSDRLAVSVPVQGKLAATDDGWCVVTDVVVDLAGTSSPDLHADSLRFRGAALDWLVDLTGAPTGLDMQADGVRLVIRTGDVQMDWLFAAQARANPIRADLALAWDPVARVLTLDRLDLDFPGENRVTLTARIAGVDLTSTGAMQMSMTSFAVTQADLTIQTHGLFEWYGLMSIGPLVLPREGDMDAAAEALRGDLLAMIARLPDPTFPPESRAALATVVAVLPNPAGVFSLSLQANPGFGPARVMGYAMTGVPTTLEAAAPLFQGVRVAVDWSPEPEL